MMVGEQIQSNRAKARSWSAAGLALVLAGCVTDDPDDDLDSGATPTSTNGETATPGSDGTSDPATSGDDASGGGSMEGTTGDEPMDSDDSTGDSESDSDSEGESTGEPTDPGPDLRELGPHAVDTSAGTAQLSTGCSMGYDLRTPAAGGDPPVVVLAHGFQGNRGTMAGWAEHWASWGVTVITPDLCHATIFDSDHAQNGADLQALVDELGLGSVVYAGYSAGGLASVIATAGDAEALALLGLDMVDADDLGAMAAPGVSVPAFDILGEPSMCNTTNNGLAVFQAAGGQVLRVTEADHCDFQSPADFLCGLTCNGTNAQFDDETIAAAVRGLSTAVVLWQTGLEPTGAQWWTPGSPYYEELAGLGILQQP